MRIERFVSYMVCLAAACVASCRLTEVALVTVRNDTREDIVVHVLLPDDASELLTLVGGELAPQWRGLDSRSR